ncbi:MAG: alpha/beta hydrolase, partial [Pseudomonadota bacterium]
RINGSALGGGVVVPLLTALVPESRITSTTDSVFAPDAVPAGYTDHVGGQLTLRRSTLRANSRQVNNLKPLITEMSKRYDTLRLPIEWLHGDADTIVPATVHALPFKERVPDTNLQLLEGVGHMPHHAQPETVIAAIDRADQASRA